MEHIFSCGTALQPVMQRYPRRTRTPSISVQRKAGILEGRCPFVSQHDVKVEAFIEALGHFFDRQCFSHDVSPPGKGCRSLCSVRCPLQWDSTMVVHAVV